MLFTQSQFMDICLYARTSRLTQMFPFFSASLEPAEITSPLRAAMYIAQLAHESGEFRYMEELNSGWNYDKDINPRLAAKLGNTKKGDGPLFKGRGPIQLTGRKNYVRATEAIGAALGVDFVKDSELVADPKYGFLVAAWLWKNAVDSKGDVYDLNTFGDAGDVEGCTKIINGGLNGLDSRLTYYRRALSVLGV